MLWLVLTLAVVVLLAVVFYRYQTAHHDTFIKMKIDHPKPSWLTGNFGQVLTEGIFQMQINLYNIYRDKKVYGIFDVRNPTLMVKDPEMIKDITVKYFNNFVDRRQLMEMEAPFGDSLILLKGDHWKHVRSIVSPTFSSGRIKRMTPHILRNCQRLVDVLRVQQERNEPVELKDLISNFTLDVIASTGFGLDVNTLGDPENQFAVHAKKSLKGAPILFLLAFFAPWLLKILQKTGTRFLPKDSTEYFSKTIDAAMEDRKSAGQAGQVNDFLDLLINADQEAGEEKKTLTRNEIHGQAIMFILGGFDTVATILSFVVFLLANNPEILQKVQEEISDKLGQDEPGYDNIQQLSYLDMCISETIRMYPPSFFIERVCTQDITLNGIQIPKGLIMSFPVYAIHHDPEIWPEPHTFQPQRFSTENKEARHPYAYLPFGYGPRNCVGMRLALIELKLALAYILKSFNPVPCEKSVYPIRLNKMQLKADDGLWVRFEARK